MQRKPYWVFIWTVLLAIIFTPALVNKVFAASDKEINIKMDAALERFKMEVDGGEAFLKNAEGVLVFPGVIKAGFGVGGEYGEGTLRIGGKTVDYYSTAAASIASAFSLAPNQKQLSSLFSWRRMR